MGVMPRHPTILLSAVLISGFVFLVLGSNRLISYPWTFDRNTLRHLSESFESYLLGDLETDFTTESINRWLAGELQESDPVAQLLGDYPRPDSWGRPFRCVRTDGQSDGPIASLGFYSLGRDGISKSNGNDADDINSWDPDSTRTYMREIQRRGLVIYIVQTMLLSPFVYWGLLGCGRVFRRWRSREREDYCHRPRP